MSAAEESTSHPDTSDTPKHQYSGQGRVRRSVEITAEEIWVGSRVGAVSLPTCPGLQWTWRRDIYCSIISIVLVLVTWYYLMSRLPHPVLCREWRKSQITIKGRVSTSQLSVEPESLYLHYLLYIYTVSTHSRYSAISEHCHWSHGHAFTPTIA